MVKRILALTVVSCLCLFSFGQSIKKVKIEDLTEYINKATHPLVVNFWATWCAPCVHELPYFQSHVKKAADRNVELVLVSLDFKEAYPRGIAKFISQKKFEGSFFWLDELNADRFCPPISDKWSGAIPATLFIDNKTGYRKFWDRALTEPQFEAELKAMLN